MKTIAIFIIVTLCFSLSVVHGQIITGWGIKTGATFANQEFEYLQTSLNMDINSRTGLDVGIFVELLPLPVLRLVPEIHYIQKGMVEEQIKAGESGPEPLGTLEYSNRVDYLSIPLLAKITIPNLIISPYLIAGPRLDIILGYDSEPVDDSIIYDNFESYDLGADFGIGVETNLILPVHILAELRFSPSFSNAYETDLLKVKNQALELLVGIKF